MTVSGNSYFPVPWTAPKKDTSVVTRSTETSSQGGSGNIPQALVGVPVAGVLGHKRVPDANTIWTGNMRPLTETQTTVSETSETGADGSTVTTTTTVTTTAVVGYLVDIHMGICLGPDVHLLGIYVDNKSVWSGDLGPARSTFTISENDTFLSKASCVFSGGAFDQSPEPDVDVPDYPGYVGVATLLLKNVRADLPMGNLSFEVYRTPNPLSLSSGNNVFGHDLNTMSALVEVLTNDWGWGGISLSDVDVAKLSSLAATLKAEGNFCSMKVGDNTSIMSIIKALQTQMSCVVFQHPETGLVTGNLIRLDSISQDANSKRFGKQNIVDVQTYKKSWWPDTVDQARGSFTSRDNSYDVPVFVQNAANVNHGGRGRKTTEIYYPYVTNQDLALDLTARALALLSTPRFNYNLVTNRDGAYVLPGDVVFVSYDDYSLINVPMLVQTVRKQPIDNNTVSLKLAQAKLPNTASLFGPGAGGPTPDFDTSPKTPLGVSFITAPYFFARGGRGRKGYDRTRQVYPVFLPVPATDLQFSFSVLQTNKPGVTGDTNIISTGVYPTYAKLTSSIDKYDGFDTGTLTSVDVYDVINPTNLLEDIGVDGVRAGRRFLIVGNEILSFEKAVNNGGGSWTLQNVYRGLLDTVAQSHSADAVAFVSNNNFNYVGPPYSANFPLSPTPSWIVVPNSIMRDGKRDEGLASSGWNPSVQRTLSPPRPHDTRVNSSRSSSPVALTIGNPLTVTWKTRNRLSPVVPIQTDSAEDRENTTSGSGPLWTQTHRVFYHPPTGPDVEIGSGTYNSNTATFNLPSVTTGTGSIYVRPEMTIDSVLYTSIFKDEVPVVVS